jgi:hypothetical protein
MTIKTWRERCEEHPDHEGIVTEQMIRNRMQEEIDELRQAIEDAVAAEREACAKVCDNRITNEAGMQREDYENRQCAAAIRARGEAEYKKGEQRLTPPPVSYHDPFGIGARQQANDLARVGEVGLWGA